jgi:hypothetical protein
VGNRNENFFGWSYEDLPITPAHAVEKIDLTENEAIFAGEVLYLTQTETKSTAFLRSNNQYYIATYNNHEQNNIHFILRDHITGTLDQQGTSVINNIQADLTRADRPPQFPDADQDIILSPTETVTGQGTGYNIVDLASNYYAPGTTTLVYSYSETEKKLEERLLPHGIPGQYGGKIFLDPSTNELYVQVEFYTVDGYGSNLDSILVPIGNADSSPY